MRKSKTNAVSLDERQRFFNRKLLIDFSASLHERIYQEQLSKAVSHLKKNHPILILLSEHESIIRSLHLLNKVNKGLQKSGQFENVTVELWEQLLQAVENFKLGRRHFEKEETYLFPRLVERGLYGNVKMIMSDHREVHDLIDRLILAFENGLEERYEETISAIDAIVTILSEKIQKLVFKENYFLYPSAIRKITGERTWREIRSEWKDIGKFRIKKAHFAA